jgi:pyrimidine-nucleoside phosphorylase
VLTKKVSEQIRKGDILAYIHANDENKLNIAKERFLKAYTYSENQPEKSRMIKHIL